MAVVAVTGAQQLTDQAAQLRLGKRWAMLPSTGREKGPCVDWKVFQGELPTAEQIREWGREFRPLRWGVVTGKLAGLVVVDFDGDQGLALMKKWQVDPHVRTGSGGFHWYLKHPGWRVPTLNAKTAKRAWRWPGVDIRGDGGFAVLLGRNANGPYERLRELTPDPFDALPEEVCTFLRDHSKGKATQGRLISIRQPATDAANRVAPGRLIEKALTIARRGGRNDSGFWLACQLRDNGFSIEEAGGAMRDYRSQTASTNTKGKVEPYCEAEMTATLRQAYSGPARGPWEKRKTRPQNENCPAAAPSPEMGRPVTDPDSQKKPSHTEIADDLKSLPLYVVHPNEPPVVQTGVPLSRTSFGRIPDEVMFDPRLDHRDVRIYGILASASRSGGRSELGRRLIAKRACCAEGVVAASLSRLETTGHIKCEPVGRGHRRRYLLLSPIFVPKPSAVEKQRPVVPNSQNQLHLSRKRPKPEVLSQPRSAAQRKSK